MEWRTWVDVYDSADDAVDDGWMIDHWNLGLKKSRLLSLEVGVCVDTSSRTKYDDAHVST